MKKILTWLIMCIFVSAILFAGGQQEAPKDGPITLVYQNWTGDSEMPWERELIDKFMEKNPDIKIELSVGPYDAHHNKIIVSTLAKSPPDVYQIIPENMFSFVNQDAALCLDPYIDKDGGDTYRDQFFDSAFSMGTVDFGDGEKCYGLPWRYGCSAMFINAQMFEEAGVAIPEYDWTWDEFLVIAEKLTDPGNSRYGFAYSGSKESFGTSWEWLGRAFSNGVPGLVSNKQPMINSRDAVEALDWWAGLSLEKKVVPPEVASLDEKAIVDMMGRGQIAMWNNGPWYINNFRNSYPDMKLVTVPLPRGKQDGSAAGGTLLAVSPLSSNKEAAWKFIKFMTSYEVLKEWATRGYFMPTRADVLDDPMYQEEPMAAFTESALREHSIILGNVPESTALLTSLHVHMQEVFLGRKNAKEALDETAAEWKNILDGFYNK